MTAILETSGINHTGGFLCQYSGVQYTEAAADIHTHTHTHTLSAPTDRRTLLDFVAAKLRRAA